MPRNYSTKRMAAENEFCTIYHFPAPLASVIWLRAANVILPCADLEPARRSHRITSDADTLTDESAECNSGTEMGSPIVAKPCSTNTLHVLARCSEAEFLDSYRCEKASRGVILAFQAIL